MPENDVKTLTISVKFTGLDELGELADKLQEQVKQVIQTVEEINNVKIGFEVEQPASHTKKQPPVRSATVDKEEHERYLKALRETLGIQEEFGE